MYLRLKHHCPSGVAGSRHHRDGRPALPALRDELLERHYAAFDWHHGGPPGPIKFIDLHQLELAAHLARAGDERAGTMVKRYVRGIECLVLQPETGAAHYATGPAWNAPCVSRTLGGQAVVIQALVIAGRHVRSCAHVRVVAQLARFVATHWPEIKHGTARPAGGAVGPARVCERAWYVSAIGAFAELYDNRPLRAAALARFDRLASELCGVNGEFRPLTHCLTLADRIAIATTASEFRAAAGGKAFTRYARRLLIAGASRHAHPAGGWIQAYRDGAPPDLDCSIELVRSADALRGRAYPELARIAIEGKRALFNPELALARMPESGLLLLLTDATGNLVPRHLAAPAGHRSACFAGNRHELLVNTRK
jgi:hypothetical protein